MATRNSVRLSGCLILALLLSACAGTVRPYELTCLPGPADEECATVADAAILHLDEEATERGRVRSAQVTAVPDCAVLARAMFEPAIAAPATAKCWAVRTTWDDGGPSTVVTLGRDGTLRVYP